jgi:phage/plasmid-like protein (TIGR03299 family)
MSAETLEWLNTQTLIGLTDRRGHAWHYREALQAAEPNHYAGFVPVEDVIERLFGFSAVSKPVYVPGLTPGTYVTVPNKQAICADDNGQVFGIFADGYQPHQYREWLLENVATLISSSQGELGIGAAVLLRDRGSACVQIEVPDTITTQDGVEFRPWLAAATSLDGSLATIYKRCITDIVCDNTRDAALGEEGQQFKLKHTRYSTLKLGDARDALQILFDAGAAFQAEVDLLCATTVSEAQWTKVLEAIVPTPADGSTVRTVNAVQRKRDELTGLWSHDDRVTPWKNTAWGVSQAFNTFNQHVATVKGSHRLERAYTNVLSGKTGQADLKVLDVLGTILDKELVAS